MRKLVMCLLGLSVISRASDNGYNATNPNAVLAPQVWAICEVVNPPEFLCRTFHTGQESYSLYLKATRDDTVAFWYKVTGTRADGQILVQEGVALKRDGATLVVINFGAPVSGSQIEVKELRENL